jgi:hypothetical protein
VIWRLAGFETPGSFYRLVTAGALDLNTVEGGA